MTDNVLDSGPTPSGPDATLPENPSDPPPNCVMSGESENEESARLASLMDDVTTVNLGEKEVSLIGTAHISQQSVDTVLHYLSVARPDTVCIELDENRCKAVKEDTSWDQIDLVQLIKQRKMTFFIARLALAAFQKNMSQYTGVKPGSEMIVAMERAEALGLQVELIDRDISTTLLRAWRNTPFFQKSKLAALLIASLFQKSEISEEELAKLRQETNLTDVMQELGDEIPFAKRAILDERDAYMAEMIRRSKGRSLAVVIGAAHKPGIIKHLESNDSVDLDALDVVPKKSQLAKILPWALPLLIIGIFVFGFLFGDVEKATHALVAWVVVNGIGGGLGALIALAHPLTILVSILAAPITSLNPLIGVGMVAAIVQAWVRPPKVSDFETVGDDFSSARSFWGNRLGKVLLVFLFSGLGSSIATFASFRWILPLLDS